MQINDKLKRRMIEDPMVMCRVLWPHVKFYPKQEDIIYSVEYNDETFVTAGHQLGKDFVTGFIVVRYFLIHHPVRIITTSVKDDHLRVLWGEIGRYISSCSIKLKNTDGGPLVINHRDIKKVLPDGNICDVSYLRGMVAEKGEALAGHHAPYALLVVDEASGVEDEVYRRCDTWAKRKLIIGNPYPCQTFFHRYVTEGDLLAKPYNGQQDYTSEYEARH
jgi:phage terminase large subunit